MQAFTPGPEDKSLCDLVEQHMKLQPGACNEVLSQVLLAFSARNGGSGEFKAGVELKLPLVEVETYRALRHFDLKSKGQRDEAQAMARDPQFIEQKKKEYLATGGEYKPLEPPPPTRNATRSLPKAGVYVLESAGVRWKVPIVGELTSDEISAYEAAVSKLSTKSRLLAVERAQQFQLVPGQKFAGTPRALIAQCPQPPAAVPPLDYDKLLSTDSKVHSSNELKTAQSCAAGTPPPRVVIIDKQIRPHPDIAEALGKAVSRPPPQDGPQCGIVAPTYAQDEHHGTYIAGFIAARGVYNQYRGINPNVALRLVPDRGNLVSLRLRLQDEYNAGWSDGNPPQIALFASTFGTDEPPGALVSDRTLSGRFKRHKGKWLDELRDGETRLSFPAGVKNIVDNPQYKYLFVVSAGQDTGEDEWPSPIALREVSNMTPQNFGTRANVLVVTACTSCDAADGGAALWDRAYYSSRGEQIVQLAAPGGDHLPGLVDEKHVGGPASGGTSAAAAIVAGVASRMLGCYPASYRGMPHLLKERLLITARQNLNEGDATKVQAGVVDPELAMIDPEKTWLKPVGLPLQPVKVHRWCNMTMDMYSEVDGEKIPESPVMWRVRRITKPEGSNNFTVREMARTSLGPDTPSLKVSKVEPYGWQSKQPFAILERPGQPRCQLYLKNVQDFVIGFEEQRRSVTDFFGSSECRPTAAAGSIKPCFQ